VYHSRAICVGERSRTAYGGSRSSSAASAGDRQAIESAVEGLKKANEANDTAAIERALEQLTAAQHKAAESMYKQAPPGDAGHAPGAEPGAAESGAHGAPSGSKSDVIDAEVVDEGKQ